jgi:hypothetical protein
VRTKQVVPYPGQNFQASNNNGWNDAFIHSFDATPPHHCVRPTRSIPLNVLHVRIPTGRMPRISNLVTMMPQ